MLTKTPALGAARASGSTFRRLYPPTQCTYSTSECDSHDNCGCNQFSAPFEVTIKRYSTTLELETMLFFRMHNAMLRAGLSALRAVKEVKTGLVGMARGATSLGEYAADVKQYGYTGRQRNWFREGMRY